MKCPMSICFCSGCDKKQIKAFVWTTSVLKEIFEYQSENKKPLSSHMRSYSHILWDKTPVVMSFT